MQSKRKIQAALALSAMALYAFGGTTPAEADASAGSAKAWAAKADVFGTNVIPETPVSETTTAGPDEDDQTLIGIPGSPLVINGTLVARTTVGPEVPSELGVASQSSPGPYSARAIGEIEDLSVLIDEGIPGGTLVSADVLRAEAVADCSSGTPVYSAASEVVDLRIGGDTSLNGPLNDLVTQIADGIHNSPLADLVDVELNVVKDLPGGGKSVDALILTVLRAAADNGAPGPLAQVTLGHAEVGATSCAGGNPRTDVPECSDGVDNADTEDTLADADDPGCHSDGNVNNPSSYDPNDDDERNECNDGIDNADPEDTLADADDPGCIHNGVWDPADPSELDALARTGASIPTGVAAGLGIGALGLLALRRRVLV